MHVVGLPTKPILTACEQRVAIYLPGLTAVYDSTIAEFGSILSISSICAFSWVYGDDCLSPTKLFCSLQTCGCPFRSSFQNRPVVLLIPLPSSHSEEMPSVHRAESHSSRGWQRWRTQRGHLGCGRLCTSEVCSGYSGKPFAQNRDLKRPSGLTLNTHIEPIILRLLGVGTN